MIQAEAFREPPIIGLGLTLGTTTRGSVNGKTSVGAPRHSRTPGKTTSSLLMGPGQGNGISLCLGLTIMKVVTPVTGIQGQALTVRIGALILQP